MARKFEFTRTIEATKAIALCFNKTTGEAENKSVMVSGAYDTDSKKLEKLVAKHVENDNTKFIEIVDTEVITKVYGISLEDFMANAVELDPKTRQPITH